MAAEGNKATALRYWEAWETGNLAIIDEIFAIDHVFHTASGGMVRSRNCPKRGIMNDRSAFPDLHSVLELVFAGEDKVLVHWTAHGTYRGDSEMVWHRLGGVRKESQQIPPTGKLVT